MTRTGMSNSVTSTAVRTVLLTGATGFIGLALGKRLLSAGYRLIALARNPVRAQQLYGARAHIVTSCSGIDATERIGAIVNLAGERILARRWSQRRRRILLDSRLRTTRARVDLIQGLERKPAVLVNMSAIGYYGVRGDEIITEAHRGQPIFQSHLCQAWEACAQIATHHNVRVCCLRAGLVLGRDGGALPQLARAARWGAASVLGSGEQWVSWIHLEDLLRLIDFCIEEPNASGAYNATAPEPCTQKEFTQILAAHFGRRTRLRMPAGMLRAALGEMAQLLVDGQRVVPLRAQCAGFEFKYPTLNTALASLYPRSTHLPPQRFSRCPLFDQRI